MPLHRLEDYWIQDRSTSLTSSEANITHQRHDSTTNHPTQWLGGQGIIEWIDCCHHSAEGRDGQVTDRTLDAARWANREYLAELMS